ncbi:MAG: hypothetical protein IIB00_08590 [candidate division Zixibacteria bacterium]|nr:hypothetical protein [candidate division Zixibacteria bacterium]
MSKYFYSESAPVAPVELEQVRTIAISRRANKVTTEDFATPLAGSGSRAFFESLPNQLKAKDLNKFLELVTQARRAGLPFHMMMGAHLIKVGLNPIVIDLMKRGIVTGISFNGAGVIHDLELAYFGGTSESVEKGINDGTFGMARETAELFNAAVSYASKLAAGLGYGAGKFILKEKAPNSSQSILAVAAKLKLPATIHVAIGADIVAQNPGFSGSMIGELSHYDFKILCAVLQKADQGGVVANIGSISLLPEVFLKALTVSRNLNKKTKTKTGEIITANFDMIPSYRPSQNVVLRPTMKTGLGFDFSGHHEIMIPLLAWGLKGKLSKNAVSKPSSKTSPKK